MKRLPVLFFTLLILFSVDVLAQSFAPVGAEWYYTEYFAFQFDVNFMHFEVTKDTVIDNKTCTVLVKEHYEYCRGRGDREYLYEKNKVVYFWDEQFSEFQTLYDFNKTAGEFWKVKVYDWQSGRVDTLIVQVDSVKTVVINQMDLTELYVKYRYKEQDVLHGGKQGCIVEKLGDLNYMMYMFDLSYLGCDGNFSGGLRCYEDPELGYYSTGISSACNYTSDIERVADSNKLLFEVYPNPSQGIFKIKSQVEKGIALKVMDLSGRTLLTKDNFAGDLIDLTKFSKGLYILEISTGAAKERRRIVIQ